MLFRSLVKDALVLDGTSLFLGITICAALLLAALVTEAYLRREDLDGPEVSMFCVTDGTTVVPLLPAQDAKRLLDKLVTRLY